MSGGLNILCLVEFFNLDTLTLVKSLSFAVYKPIQILALLINYQLSEFREITFHFFQL